MSSRDAWAVFAFIALHKKVIQSASTSFANVQTTHVVNGMFLCTTTESHRILAVVQKKSDLESLHYPQSFC